MIKNMYAANIKVPMTAKIIITLSIWKNIEVAKMFRAGILNSPATTKIPGKKSN